MFDAEAGWYAYAAMAIPGINGRAPLVEGHRLSGFIAERCHGHGAQLAGADGSGDAGEVEFARQQFTQGRVVQQRHGDVTAKA
ncbi:hypothetical protein D9M68_945290 [compost metagenome]